MPRTTGWDKDRAAEIIEAHKAIDGPALPILHALQREYGYIADEAIPLIASALNVSRAEMHGIVSFYHDFRREPPGRHVLKLCRAEACQSRGGDALADHAKARLRLDWSETVANGAITLEPVYCLGLCACAPAAMLDGKPVGRLDRERLDALLAEARS